jgi:hypothetical protein
MLDKKVEDTYVYLLKICIRMYRLLNQYVHTILIFKFLRRSHFVGILVTSSGEISIVIGRQRPKFEELQEQLPARAAGCEDYSSVVICDVLDVILFEFYPHAISQSSDRYDVK